MTNIASSRVNFCPSKHLVEDLQKHGVSWAEVVEDLEVAEVTRPDALTDNRRLLHGERFLGVIVDDTHDGLPTHLLISVRRRERCESEFPVVGIETKGPKSSRSGGNGRQWPTSYGELIVRLEGLDGVKVVPGGKHRRVERYGKLVDMLPNSTSDWRSLLNACQQLRRKGLDVSVKA